MGGSGVGGLVPLVGRDTRTSTCDLFVLCCSSSGRGSGSLL